MTNQYVLSAAGQAELSRLIGAPVKIGAVETIDHFYSDGATVGATYVCVIAGEKFYLSAFGTPLFGTMPAQYAAAIQEFIMNARSLN